MRLLCMRKNDQRKLVVTVISQSFQSGNASLVRDLDDLPERKGFDLAKRHPFSLKQQSHKLRAECFILFGQRPVTIDNVGIHAKFNGFAFCPQPDIRTYERAAIAGSGSRTISDQIPSSEREMISEKGLLTLFRSDDVISIKRSAGIQRSSSGMLPLAFLMRSHNQPWTVNAAYRRHSSAVYPSNRSSA